MRYEHSQRFSTQFSFAPLFYLFPLLCTLNFAAFSRSLITFHLFLNSERLLSSSDLCHVFFIVVISILFLYSFDKFWLGCALNPRWIAKGFKLGHSVIKNGGENLGNWLNLICSSICSCPCAKCEEIIEILEDVSLWWSIYLIVWILLTNLSLWTFAIIVCVVSYCM